MNEEDIKKLAERMMLEAGAVKIIKAKKEKPSTKK